MIPDRSLLRMEQRDRVVEAMERNSVLFSPRLIERMSSCAEIEVFSRSADGRLRTLYAQRCQHRACPICQRYKHHKVASFLSRVDSEQRQIAEEAIGKSITDEAWYKRYKFVTLSPFVSSFNLDDLADKLSWLSQKFTQHLNYYFRGEVKPLGYFRTFEITYDPEKGFHPHMHAILLYPERSPYVDQIAVERSLYKCLKKSPYLGILSDGRIQETVSVDIRDGFKKEDSYSFEFELSKYITKVEDFEDLDVYVRLIHAWGRVPQFRASGCFSGMDKPKEKKEGIIQNANCTNSVLDDLDKNSEYIMFRTDSGKRRSYSLSRDSAIQISHLLRLKRLRRFNSLYGISVFDEHRRWASLLFGEALVYWFDSGGDLHTKLLPMWTEKEENFFLSALKIGFIRSHKLSKKVYKRNGTNDQISFF